MVGFVLLTLFIRGLWVLSSAQFFSERLWVQLRDFLLNDAWRRRHCTIHRTFSARHRFVSVISPHLTKITLKWFDHFWKRGTNISPSFHMGRCELYVHYHWGCGYLGVVWECIIVCNWSMLYLWSLQGHMLSICTRKKVQKNVWGLGNKYWLCNILAWQAGHVFVLIFSFRIGQSL